MNSNTAAACLPRKCERHLVLMKIMLKELGDRTMMACMYDDDTFVLHPRQVDCERMDSVKKQVNVWTPPLTKDYKTLVLQFLGIVTVSTKTMRPVHVPGPRAGGAGR